MYTTSNPFPPAAVRGFISRSGGHTPGDSVAQQRNKRLGFPCAVKGRRCGGRRVDGGAGRADRGVVAMAESKVGHSAAANLAGIAEDASLAVGLQGGVRGVEGPDGGGYGARAVIRGQEDLRGARTLQW